MTLDRLVIGSRNWLGATMESQAKTTGFWERRCHMSNYY